ncbi:scavenger receptor class b type-1 sr-b1 [Holotrichia oblita]|uniref:Scavenger receptor class b type-1 sr-b1 n=1 Tax=Holotrichia oblita TaxID=644536 RepID=A0ACB9TXC6_HOLOL|nr:scavenger receptor class b type-1 sr-b1 [Holotrichia oblita]
MVKKEIVKLTRLENGTEQYNRWRELPFPLEFRIYVFNVTNPNEVLEKGATPIVHEVGPFVYHEHFYKKKFVNKNNNTLLYNHYLKMEFQRNLSAYADDHNVTIVNLPLQLVFQDEEEGLLPPAIQSTAIDYLWPRAFGNNSIFITLPANTLFFKGYTFCNTKPKEPDPNLSVADKITETLIRAFMRFSMFSYKDNSSDGQFQVYSGMRNINKLGQIKTWKGKSHLETWIGGKKSSCNRMRGTDSTIYAPGLFRNLRTTIYTFNTDICRTIKFRVRGEVEFKGIPGVKAIMGPENLENSGENSCYCVKKTRDILGDYNCFPKGFCDMGNCLKSPVVISFPHMLWADKRYSNTIKGLQPSEEKHMSFLSVEPTTGTPLQGRKRVQFNIPMRPLDIINATKNLRPTMMPLLWVEEMFDLPDNMLYKAKGGYISNVKYLDIASYVMIGSGVIGTTVITMLGNGSQRSFKMLSALNKQHQDNIQETKKEIALEKKRKTVDKDLEYFPSDSGTSDTTEESDNYSDRVQLQQDTVQEVMEKYDTKFYKTWLAKLSTNLK